MTRAKLPPRRRSNTYSLDLLTGTGRLRLHVTLGFYPDGRLGELFLTCSKQGTFLRSALDQWARAVSRELQRGAPVSEIVAHHRNVYGDGGRIETDGVLNGRFASSPWDAVAQLLEVEA